MVVEAAVEEEAVEAASQRTILYRSSSQHSPLYQVVEAPLPLQHVQLETPPAYLACTTPLLTAHSMATSSSQGM